VLEVSFISQAAPGLSPAERRGEAMTLGLTSPLLSSIAGVSHRFFGRVGGTSPHPWAALNTSFDVSDSPARVEENLARIRFQIGVPAGALYACTQVHGAAVEVVDGSEEPEEVRARKADALVTLAKDTAVGVRTADCAPILLAIDDGSAVAAVHAGWRGAVGGVLEAAVATLRERSGVDAKRIVAAIGPTIGIDAFEVGPEVVDAARAAIGDDVTPLVRAGKGDRLHLELRGVVARILTKAGVERVDIVGGCTVSEESAYFSHRRDVTLRKGSETGRQLSVIARTTPPVIDADMFR
jgi:YfiH family protein